MKKVDEFMQKIRAGKMRNVSQLEKFKEEILELRDVHNCSFSQIKDFLAEHKIKTCVQAIGKFYREEKQKIEEANMNTNSGVVEIQEPIISEDKSADKNAGNALEIVKKAWGK